MAFENGRTFYGRPGITSEQIGRSLINYLQTEKKMYAEGCRTDEGYFVQAKSNEGTIKKIAGLSTATQVQIAADEFGEVNVEIGSGKWADKLGAGVLAYALFAPLAATAVFGSVKQGMLPREIYSYIDLYLVSAEPEALPEPATRTSMPVYETRASATSASGNSCPHCSQEVPAGAKFCTECGARMPQNKFCAACGAPLKASQKFCTECGERV